MGRYHVTIQRVDSFFVEVEADSPEGAIDAAYDSDAFQNAPNLCAQCSGWGRSGPSVDDGEWEVDEESIVEIGSQPDDGGQP